MICSACHQPRESIGQSYCKKCHAKYMREWRKTRPSTNAHKELIRTGVEVVEDFLSNISSCVLQDYGRVNRFLVDAKDALRKLDNNP